MELLKIKAKHLFDDITFLYDEVWVKRIVHSCIAQRAFAYIDRMPATAWAEAGLAGSAPWLFHTLDDGVLVYHKECSRFFRGPAAQASQTVYAIECGDGFAFKIGIAQNVETRLSILQTGSPLKLKVVGIIRNGGTRLEHRIHRKFANIRLNGEWFKGTAELRAFIEKEFQPWRQ